MFTVGSEYLKVRKTLKKGRGVYAQKTIPGGSVIADYLGKIIKADTGDETEMGGVYETYWKDDLSILPDTHNDGAHNFNHSCMPNATFYQYHMHFLIVAVRKIFPGEEICISYLIDPDECKDTVCTHWCYCGTPLCTSTMHTTASYNILWDKFASDTDGNYPLVEYQIGNQLDRLQNYPVSLPDHNFFPIYGNLSNKPLLLTSADFPSISEIRNLIRHTGLRLLTSKRDQIVLGVNQAGLIVSSPVSAII